MQAILLTLIIEILPGGVLIAAALLVMNYILSYSSLFYIIRNHMLQ